MSVNGHTLGGISIILLIVMLSCFFVAVVEWKFKGWLLDWFALINIFLGFISFLIYEVCVLAIPEYFTYTGAASVFLSINYFVELYFIVY